MNDENHSTRMRLDDEGELRDGIFCNHCGHVNFTPSQTCEACGNLFPKPFSPLRLRLEALRRSEEKQKDRTSSQWNEWAALSRVVVWLYIFISLALCLFVVASDVLRIH